MTDKLTCRQDVSGGNKCYDSNEEGKPTIRRTCAPSCVAHFGAEHLEGLQACGQDGEQQVQSPAKAGGVFTSPFP